MTRTRFAPSPTGYLHIGGLRTAAYAYALAKKSDGKFLLRIEDTDQKREVKGAKDKIYSILKQFGLDWDEGPLVGGPHAPYIQSERISSGIYQKAAEKLLADGHAFYCFCKPRSKDEVKSDRLSGINSIRDVCRDLSQSDIDAKLASGEKPAVRLRIPDNEIVEFTDFIVGKPTVWKSEVVPDAMLLKSDGFPTYHLAMPVDDTEMGITHVVRAMEWFTSTPIHILIFKYLNYPMPQIGHPSAILDPSGGKLSKRKGGVSCEEFLEAGYLPEAILNFVILLGWAPKDNRELYSLSDFVAAFDIGGFQKSNPVFNTTKLDWFNSQYLKLKTNEELCILLKPFITVDDLSGSQLLQVIPLVRDRLKKLSDINDLIKIFISTSEEINPDPSLFTPNALNNLTSISETVSRSDFSGVEKLNTEFSKEIERLGEKTGNYYMDMRIALSGSKFSPPITDSALILGKDEAMKRLQKSINNLKNR